MPHAPPRHRTTGRRAGRWLLAAVLAAAGIGRADEPERASLTDWSLGAGDCQTRIELHGRSAGGHRGSQGERIALEATNGTTLRLETPLGPAAVIDELRAAVWIKANRPDVRLSIRVMLPDHVSTTTGRTVELLVPGSLSRDVDRWEQLEIRDLPRTLAKQLPALRLEHGSEITLANAVATHLVLDLYTGPGRYDITIDDLLVSGVVSPVAPRHRAIRDPLVQAAAATQPVPAAAGDPPAGITRGVLEVAGLPFFPRAIDHQGEPLATLASLGFNCVRLAEPASGELLAEARAAGIWVICPPPEIPDVDIRDPDSMPMLRNWDRVLIWDMGSGLTAASVAELAERARRVRTCDTRPGRPLVASADTDLRTLSRHVDMLLARKTVLGTSLELLDYMTWLKERPRLARPGTPLVATLATEIDPRAARQAAALAGVGGRGLAVDAESLSLAALSAVAAGTRGIFFTSSRRIDGDDRESRSRAAAVRETNLRLAILEPWGAAGRFAATAQASSPEVQAMVLEASRARMLVVWRCVQGSQIVARRYAHGDLPGGDATLTILVPGVPEAHRAYEVAPGGLRPLKQKRVTGGVSVTLDAFHSQALVLLSGEPAVTAHVQDRIHRQAIAELDSARGLAGVALADASDLLGRLPGEAFSGPPPVAAVPMLTLAGQTAAEGDMLVAQDPATAVARFRLAAAIAGQFERRIWENGVHADGSMVASPLAVSDATLAEHWRFVAARTATTAGPELLAGGGMERIDELAAAGWRHFAQEQPGIRTAVELSPHAPAVGSGSLRLAVTTVSPEETPVVLETPPLWITTPPIAAPPGKLVEIAARVRVPEPIKGSVDGLLVFDSLGGPALAERVAQTRDWSRLVLYRIVPDATAEEPLVVTFAVTGIGEAHLDDISVRVLERAVAGSIPVTAVSTAAPSGGFPTPADLIRGQPADPAATPPPAAAPPPPGTWPGLNLGWPQLPFGQSSAPASTPEGGRVDPFKRPRVDPPAP